MSAKNEFGLTGQQEAFAQAVAQGLSLADAYRKAYKSTRKMMAKTVHEAASRLAAEGKVAARIAACRKRAIESSDVTVDRVLREMARISFADPKQLMNADGTLKSLLVLDDDTAAAIASVEVDEYGKIKYKFWDKNTAAKELAKFLGMYEKDNRQRTNPIQALAEAIVGKTVGPRGITITPKE
jgi:phage terminase small subunit